MVPLSLGQRNYACFSSTTEQFQPFVALTIPLLGKPDATSIALNQSVSASLQDHPCSCCRGRETLDVVFLRQHHEPPAVDRTQ